MKMRVFVLLFLMAVDVLLIRHAYQTRQSFPFSLPPVLEQHLAQVLPSSSPIPLPLEAGIELSDSQWVGSIVYGKLTNHGTQTVQYPTLYFTVSTDQEGTEYIASYTATISARIAPSESIYFSQRFQTPTQKEFWWNGRITRVSSDSGETITQPPRGQQVSSKPITVPTTSTAVQKPADGPWGVAKQIDDVTWTIRVGEDERIATPQEVYQALNEYRERHGSPRLEWDPTLASYAQERAAYLNSIKSTDQHKGFKDYINNEDNVKHLGFWSLGENSGYGHKLLGVHLIEWIYASDPAHNSNQLSKSWSHVGIGVQGLAVAFIFGGNKM